MLWTKLKSAQGELRVAEEKDHGGKNNLGIVRHKNAHRSYLMEGIWQILEHQQ